MNLNEKKYLITICFMILSYVIQLIALIYIPNPNLSLINESYFDFDCFSDEHTHYGNFSFCVFSNFDNRSFRISFNNTSVMNKNCTIYYDVCQELFPDHLWITLIKIIIIPTSSIMILIMMISVFCQCNLCPINDGEFCLLFVPYFNDIVGFTINVCLICYLIAFNIFFDKYQYYDFNVLTYNLRFLPSMILLLKFLCFDFKRVYKCYNNWHNVRDNPGPLGDVQFSHNMNIQLMKSLNDS